MLRNKEDIAEMFYISSQDDQDLSQEEQDCIQFFEKTIDSLEASLEEDDWRLVRARPFESATQEVTRPVAMSTNPYTTNPKDHDIIDLVHKEADSVHSKEPIFSPNHRGSVQQLAFVFGVVSYNI